MFGLIALASAAPRYLVIPLDDVEFEPHHRVVREVEDDMEPSVGQPQPDYQPMQYIPEERQDIGAPIP